MKLILKQQENKLIEAGDLVIPKYLEQEKFSEKNYRLVISLSKGRFYNLIDLFGEVYTTGMTLEQVNKEYSLVAKNNQLEIHINNL